jgi:AraC family transcriptional regulator
VDADLWAGIGEVDAAQADGSPPTTLATGSAPGESGVSVLRVRFHGGMHFTAVPQRHCVCFQMPRLRSQRRMAGRALRREAPAGSLAICPAGFDCAADVEESADALLVAIDPGWFSLAAAEDSALEAQLIGCLFGYDQALLDLAHTLALESTAHHPNGPLFWNEVAGDFIDNLLARHASEAPSQVRGMLGKTVLKRLRDYIIAHLDEPIEVNKLASIAGRSPFHFSRVFTRSVGLTPHRYVVYLRVLRATELVRDGQLGLAEIAARTGFADQSHLSRWVRRVHGVPLTKLAA